ncbi:MULTISPECIES: hypothetical protein [Dehalobacter]|uniref:OB-fold protein n=1 Tax=Dehalobacter TaxID=56112 RepID=UPI00258365FE|nr:hypothetical protein [Dehalobacter sp.]MDJ0305406.1 hypothetical protein [Dehalobacter sp.]
MSDEVKVKKPITKRWWFWMFIVIIAIAAISNLGSNDNSTASAPTDNQAKQSDPAPPTTPMVVTVDKLIEDLDNNALNASNTYKDKYVEITGQLSNIDSSGNYFSIGPLDGSFSLFNVMCYITEEQKATVAKFTNKQKVTVIGTITDVGEVIGYSLDVESIK